MSPGVATAWTRLGPEQRLAAVAALGLVVSLFLPWYEKSVFAPTRGGIVSASESLNAFQVISWVEAAVVLVAFGVLFLIWARSQNKGFHLPGGDGTVILVAGGWAALLLMWRLFDKPDVAGAGATVGIQWGWFVALVMAGLRRGRGLPRARGAPARAAAARRRPRLGQPAAPGARRAPRPCPAQLDGGQRGAAGPPGLVGRAAARRGADAGGPLRGRHAGRSLRGAHAPRRAPARLTAVGRRWSGRACAGLVRRRVPVSR